MQLINKIILVGTLALLSAGCSTVGRFKIPEGDQLFLGGRPIPVEVHENGVVRTRPYFWSSAGGIRYRLEKDGQTIKEGKVKSRFRVASIFWPPYALIYWPFGFDQRQFNDLTIGLEVNTPKVSGAMTIDSDSKNQPE